MAKPKITLFVDIVSPFAYMAFYALEVSDVLYIGPQGWKMVYSTARNAMACSTSVLIGTFFGP